MPLLLRRPHIPSKLGHNTIWLLLSVRTPKKISLVCVPMGRDPLRLALNILQNGLQFAERGVEVSVDNHIVKEMTVQIFKLGRGQHHLLKAFFGAVKGGHHTEISQSGEEHRRTG